MLPIFALILAPLVVGAVDFSEGAVPACEQDAESSAVLLLQTSFERVAVGIGPEGFEAASAKYEAVAVEAMGVSAADVRKAEEHDTDMAALQTGFNVSSGKKRTIGKQAFKVASAEVAAAQVQVTYEGATVVPSPLDNALAEIRHLEEEEPTEVDSSPAHQELATTAAQASEKQAPKSGFSLLETFHGAGAALHNYAAISSAARVASTTSSAEAVSLILMMSVIVLMAAVVACLMAGQRSSQPGQGQRLLQGAGAGSQRQMSPKVLSQPGSVAKLPMQAQHRAGMKPPSPMASGSTAYLPPTAGKQAQVMSRPSLEQAPSGPPPICPSLILPYTESRFMISMDSLVKMTTGTLDILGTSGRKLLHGSVTDTADGRRSLVLSSVGCEDDPRTTATTFAGSAAGPGVELFGRLGQFYGTLENASSGGGMCLTSGGRPVMTLETSSQADLMVTASTMDGRVLASAARNAGLGSRGGEGSDIWRLQVKAGVDAVLVTTCMLARILLLPWPSERPSTMQAPSGRPSLMSVQGAQQLGGR